MTASPFVKLDAAVPDPDQRSGYYFLAGILYGNGVTDLTHLDRIVATIARSEVLPLDPEAIIKRFTDAPAGLIPYTVPDGPAQTLYPFRLDEISHLSGGANVSTATPDPLPEGTMLVCTRCKTRLTRIGTFPDDRRCPCGGTFEEVQPDEDGTETAQQP